MSGDPIASTDNTITYYAANLQYLKRKSKVLADKMKVAIIGSGASGLVAIKSSVDEGLQPVCFEQEDAIGGLWRFTKEVRHSSVYRTTVINTSKEMMCFSDFPIPKDFPPFMHNTKVMEYFHLYAKHFDLYKYIKFNTKILKVQKADDYEDSGNWEVTYVNQTSSQNKPKKEVFNAVMVCVGHHAIPNWPNPGFPGTDIFKGVKMHSHSYKDFKEFQGKTVLVIGVGNSGGDIAVELSRHASQVHLSTRKGCWVLGRLHPNGRPNDYMFNRRVFAMLPRKFLLHIFKRRLNNTFDHKEFGLQPDCLPGSQHPTVNDDLPYRIMNGTIIVKPNVDHFTESGVIFVDETSVDHLDAVIFCTGYNIEYPFLDKSVIHVERNEVKLYKYMFPPDLSKPTIAVIGCFQPLGAINPLSELQCRWATRVFKGLCKLPSKCQMIKDIIYKKEAMANRYYASQRHTIQVDYIPYGDELAEQIGCKPSFLKLLLTDPVLAFYCFFGSCTPPQYRLIGPGVWSGAREAIMKADSNIVSATKTRQLQQGNSSQMWLAFQMTMFLGIIVAVLIKIYL